MAPVLLDTGVRPWRQRCALGWRINSLLLLSGSEEPTRFYFVPSNTVIRAIPPDHYHGIKTWKKNFLDPVAKIIFGLSLKSKFLWFFDSDLGSPVQTISTFLLMCRIQNAKLKAKCIKEQFIPPLSLLHSLSSARGQSCRSASFQLSTWGLCAPGHQQVTQGGLLHTGKYRGDFGGGSLSLTAGGITCKCHLLLCLLVRWCTSHELCVSSVANFILAPKHQNVLHCSGNNHVREVCAAPSSLEFLSPTLLSVLFSKPYSCKHRVV